MESLRPDVSICHNASSENKCQQLLTLPFVLILIFLIGYLSVEISQLPTVSIYSGRLPVVMKNGLQVLALQTSLSNTIKYHLRQDIIFTIKHQSSMGH